MNDKKNPADQTGANPVYPQSNESLARQHNRPEKHKPHYDAKEDKRKTVREEHTNGSTSADRL